MLLTFRDCLIQPQLLGGTELIFTYNAYGYDGTARLRVQLHQSFSGLPVDTQLSMSIINQAFGAVVPLVSNDWEQLRRLPDAKWPYQEGREFALDEKIVLDYKGYKLYLDDARKPFT